MVYWAARHITFAAPAAAQDVSNVRRAHQPSLPTNTWAWPARPICQNLTNVVQRGFEPRARAIHATWSRYARPRRTTVRHRGGQLQLLAASLDVLLDLSIAPTTRSS